MYEYLRLPGYMLSTKVTNKLCERLYFKINIPRVVLLWAANFRVPTPPEPYIGCPCPWVLGGHGCDIIGNVNTWAQFE